jgi:Pentapeptide repeats (8 copies)
MADDGSQKRKPGFKTAVEDGKAIATVLAMEAEAVFGRRAARVVGVLLLFGTLLALLGWYIAPSGAEQKQAFVVTIAQILGGTALLSGLYFTWRTLQVNREGQITERFTRAIDQLGSEELEVRLGGIYALERIARDSERDHWPIMEVLTAYVRQHAPWRPGEGSQEEGTEDATLEEKPWDRYVERVAKSVPSAADIRAIQTVIRRRTHSFAHGEPEGLDLRETNFSRASLEKANLNVANLSRANLSRAGLGYASLWAVELAQAKLIRANLAGANLTLAGLYEADLSHADLERADLSGSAFSRAILERLV